MSTGKNVELELELSFSDGPLVDTAIGVHRNCAPMTSELQILLQVTDFRTNLGCIAGGA